MPQWYADRFELKASEALQAQEKFLLPFLNYVEEFKLGAWPMIRVKTRKSLGPMDMSGHASNYRTGALPTSTSETQ